MGLPVVRDRVVQGAVKQVIEPIFEREFAETRYGFRPGRACQQALERVEEKLKATIREKTSRTRGVSLETILADVNRTLRGWHAYFRRSLRNELAKLDQRVRRRLRSILMKRCQKRGIDWQQANRLWPNAYFTGRGLYTMAPALAMGRQSR